MQGHALSSTAKTAMEAASLKGVLWYQATGASSALPSTVAAFFLRSFSTMSFHTVVLQGQSSSAHQLATPLRPLSHVTGG